MAMVIKVSWILGITFVLSTFLSEVSGIGSVIGHFKMIQKHPELKKCAEAMLQENECVAVRRSKLTGQCESLPYSWAKDEIMESGYDYAKKVFVQENFRPPHTLDLMTSFKWQIPGVLKTGAKVDTFVWVLPGFRGLRIGLSDANMTFTERFSLLFSCDEISTLEGTKNLKTIPNWLPKCDSRQQLKITLLVQTDADEITVYINDVKETFRLKFRLDVMRIVTIIRQQDSDCCTVDRLQFTKNVYKA